MSFDVSKITDNGLQQLAAVSATKTLCIDSIICLSDEFDEEDVVTQPESYWLNHASKLSNVTGRVISAGENPNTPDTSRLVIELTATEDTTVKTLIVCAHTSDSGISGNEGTFYGLSDPEGIEVLYNSGVTVKTQIAISFSFNRSSEITISEDTSASNYLLSSEVGRFVTTHKAGDPDNGETQLIKGNKSFDNNVFHYDDVFLEDDAKAFVNYVNSNGNDHIEVAGNVRIAAENVLRCNRIFPTSLDIAQISITGALNVSRNVNVAGGLTASAATVTGTLDVEDVVSCPEIQVGLLQANSRIKTDEIEPATNGRAIQCSSDFITDTGLRSLGSELKPWYAVHATVLYGAHPCVSSALENNTTGAPQKVYFGGIVLLMLVLNDGTFGSLVGAAPGADINIESGKIYDSLNDTEISFDGAYLATLTADTSDSIIDGYNLKIKPAGANARLTHGVFKLISGTGYKNGSQGCLACLAYKTSEA